MTKTHGIRKLLNQLAALGLLLDYSVHMRYGQSVMLGGAGRRPRVMRLGTAKAAALAAERAYWWGGDALSDGRGTQNRESLK